MTITCDRLALRLLITVSLVALGISACQPNRADVENSRIDWDSSPADILASEAETPEDQSKTRLTYVKNFKDKDYHLEYLFDSGGRLENVLYYRAYPNEGVACGVEYARVMTELSDQYGSPDSMDANVATMDCSEVGSGEIKLSSAWDGADTRIELVLDTWYEKPYVGISHTPAEKSQR